MPDPERTTDREKRDMARRAKENRRKVQEAQKAHRKRYGGKNPVDDK